MAKSKTGPALFDLITKDEADPADALKVPGWWERRGPTESETASLPKPAVRTLPRAGSGSPRPMDARNDGPPGRTPFIELDGDRFRVSFTSVTAALGVFALLVVLIGTFELGRRLERPVAFRLGVDAGRTAAEAQGSSEVEMVRAQPPASGVVDDLLAKPPVKTATPAVSQRGRKQAVASPGWVRGFTYVVAQEFAVGRSADAGKARAFLSDEGIATKLIRLTNGGFQLITTQGYDRTDATQRGMAQQLEKKVRAAGRRYYADGGGYKLEGYLKTRKNDSW